MSVYGDPMYPPTVSTQWYPTARPTISCTPLHSGTDRCDHVIKDKALSVTHTRHHAPPRRCSRSGSTSSGSEEQYVIAATTAVGYVPLDKGDGGCGPEAA
ncbi:hypothetical protein J6590_023737 [Homalodisca vitripennis]|nr:hypothetical protein J6590_023737 [Homalodisca vitripennis]